MSFYDKVLALCRENGISITALAIALGMSKSTPNNWKTMDKPPRSGTIKKVADYFEVSPEYFTEASMTNTQTVNDNHGIIGQTHAPVTIINDGGSGLTDEESELLKLYKNLNIVDRAKLLVYASDMIANRQENN